MIRFQFIDPVNGYIELDMNIPQERSVKGWTLVPHKRPLRVIIALSRLTSKVPTVLYFPYSTLF